MKTGREIVQKKVYCQGELPFSIDVKGGEKHQKHEDRGRNGHRGSMSVVINAKGGDCWKVGCSLMSTLEEASKKVRSL
jgi:hypothetical protein